MLSDNAFAILFDYMNENKLVFSHIIPDPLLNDEPALLTYAKTEGRSPTVVFLGGFRSDMTGTKALALEVASRNITVNAVAPGLIDTDMTRAISADAHADWADRIPLKRLGRPEDIASAVVFLASDEASYITGHVLAVNGGMYM